MSSLLEITVSEDHKRKTVRPRLRSVAMGARLLLDLQRGVVRNINSFRNANWLYRLVCQ